MNIQDYKADSGSNIPVDMQDIDEIEEEDVEWAKKVIYGIND